MIECRERREEGGVGADSRIKRSAAAASRYRWIRESVDPIVAAVLLVLLSPILLLIAIAVRIDSAGPIFFRQRRVGWYGSLFTMLKFRTMSVTAPRSSLKMADDHPAITRVGRWLRRTGVDELPNLWNVMEGDMALIGPRPEQADLIGYYQPWQLERHLVKPGITGWWQIHHRDNEPMHLNVDKDIFYVRNQSLLLDVRIVLGTVKVLFSPLRLLWSRVPVPPELEPAPEVVEITADVSAGE